MRVEEPAAGQVGDALHLVLVCVAEQDRVDVHVARPASGRPRTGLPNWSGSMPSLFSPSVISTIE